MCLNSDFPKSCQARESKIFRLTSRPNHRHNSARLTADEGRSRTSRTRGEMRWTLTVRSTFAPEAYGEVVWFGRRGAGVKRAIRSAGDGGKRAVLRGEHEVSRKAIAQGRPECSACTCMLVCPFVCANRTRDRGCSKHPVFPAPSDRRGQTKMQASDAMRREIAASYSVVIAREGGRSSIPETVMIESIGRGVLDPPHARGMTV